MQLHIITQLWVFLNSPVSQVLIKYLISYLLSLSVYILTYLVYFHFYNNSLNLTGSAQFQPAQSSHPINSNLNLFPPEPISTPIFYTASLFHEQSNSYFCIDVTFPRTIYFLLLHFAQNFLFSWHQFLLIPHFAPVFTFARLNFFNNLIKLT